MSGEKATTPEVNFIEEFTSKLKRHAVRKAELYDGVSVAGQNNENNVDFFLRFATEELGEVASAITRERHLLAQEECMDLAHTAMLISLAIEASREGK